SPRSRSGSRPHYAAPRRAATAPVRLRGTRRRQASGLRPNRSRLRRPPLGWTRCCAARLEQTNPARRPKRPKALASPRRRRENQTRKAVATTTPQASPQRRRENRTRRAVAMTAPIPNRVPPAMLQPTRAGELRTFSHVAFVPTSDIGPARRRGGHPQFRRTGVTEYFAGAASISPR